MAVRGRPRQRGTGSSRRKRICSRRSRRRVQRGGNPSGGLEISWPGGQATAAPGPMLSRGIVAAKPAVKILSPSTNPLLLVCTDPDAPAGTWLHWLLLNPHSSPEDIVPWAPPTPPKGSGVHRYQFRLYEMSGPAPPAPKSRAAFPLESFVVKHGLKLLDEKEIRISAEN
jgi:phosphatidylethanolamine-binding protein (PEBP) family uncharacterized protein